ncbi:TatD family hydrolase [Candidatus Woesearchaeota archaeon]|nr:TatD family hydrolase [Candidatus Woesearchaeota archaeon]
MILVDVHSHLYSKQFKEDIDKVIKRAESAGVKAIIAAGVDEKTNRETLELAKKYKIVKAALGIYPPDALERETGKPSQLTSSQNIDKEIKFIESKKNEIIALSEFGLDYLSEDADKKTQQEIFVKLLNLAKNLDKPVIVHSRKAEADVIDILEKENMKNVVLHCFCGKTLFIKRAIEKGWYFSIPTNIVKSQQFQDMVKSIPLQQLLTETDAPFLSPYKDAAGKSKRNEPCFIIESIKKIAEIKGMTQEDIANIVFSNYQRLFL